MASKECRACGHVNPSPTGEQYEACPACGRIYSRVQAALDARAELEVRRERGIRRRPAPPRPDPAPAPEPSPALAVASSPAAPRGKNLVVCVDCGGQVSKSAETCPHCGLKLEPEQTPAQAAGADRIAFWRVVFFLGGALWLVSLFLGDDDSSGSATTYQTEPEKHLRSASTACRPLIEDQARWGVEWMNSWMEPIFDRYQDRGNEITYRGDKARFQNGFGAWRRVDYTCIYDVPARRAVRATVIERP